MWQRWVYTSYTQSTATAHTHTARGGCTNRRARVDRAARATQLRWRRGRSPTVCCEPWMCWVEHRGAVSNDNSRGHGCSNEWVAGRVPRPRGVHSLATRARVVRVKRKQHAAARESCCGRTLALRNDIWVPSIRACRSVHDNTIVRDILEPPTHVLPTTWRHHCQPGGGTRPAGQDPPVEGQPCGEGRFMHVTGIAYSEL